ncbi:MAG: hypothetical protein DCF15_15260 [Phormidesmis priestleyi]|uniref:Galactosyltransferase C-terminal domain-containing protein n=1 Tax=Phormidesmis priestleyi TaxID=268141 RepID=A0A2W4YXT5_9CYAN|nr:MAG: hypothetical protein DCF15_15260 [Phormidesmis priestleyi]
MQLTLITPYRNRLHHLINQLAWWEHYPFKRMLQWIVVEVTRSPSAALQQMLEKYQITYLHLFCEGTFHKTKALNLGLNCAKGEFVAAFDVDLIPLGRTLERHCWLAERSPYCLLTGYRLMAATDTVNLTTLTQSLEQVTTAPEDQPTALRKHLLKGERFGVMPLFRHDRLLAVNGWDEAFIGWGAEDQDLIERYLSTDQALCRCPELTYLHLRHELAADWNSTKLTECNRAYYYNRR